MSPLSGSGEASSTSKGNKNEPNNNHKKDDEPTTPTHLKVDERTKGRKKLRRSVSFSEGQSPVKTPVKSGYNRTQSTKYDAHSAFDKLDIVYSKRDQIQVSVIH